MLYGYWIKTKLVILLFNLISVFLNFLATGHLIFSLLSHFSFGLDCITFFLHAGSSTLVWRKDDPCWIICKCRQAWIFFASTVVLLTYGFLPWYPSQGQSNQSILWLTVDRPKAMRQWLHTEVSGFGKYKSFIFAFSWRKHCFCQL
jgi:hypothetical protein